MGEVLAVDLGGTNFRMARVSNEGEILKRAALSTRESRSVGEGLEQLVQLVEGADVQTLVFGAPGVVDHAKGQVVYAPNLDQEFLAELSVSALEGVLNKKVILVNDADMAALGESELGAGKGGSTVLYVTCSTGIGAGVIHEGQLLRGHYSTMEVGHTRLGLEAMDEGESLASGTALARMAKEAGLLTENPDLVKLAAANAGIEREVLSRVTEAFGILLSNLSWLLAPDKIVVGGGLGLSDPIVLELTQQVFDRSVPKYLYGLRLAPAQLGDDAGLRGAAFVEHALARRSHLA
ncbi:ROK family protein [Ferrimicrobium acidiphilum]|jgi:glucokinase|uniref:Glucokinase n=1 Tax=Ferrimicrobium acidiphilum DSM 19497 TaxID=1121877 RepID=A0A0D8FYT2_9ACTN|nr:ROK family protein [Ferrimicrobium acidiphilum]KJE77817.1 glucokinase [Ferrimicrobium acidiphilum DSM 19497]MCL5052723.1 ROK family protein [Gammaproteobacteria bacterium]